MLGIEVMMGSVMSDNGEGWCWWKWGWRKFRFGWVTSGGGEQ